MKKLFFLLLSALMLAGTAAAAIPASAHFWEENTNYIILGEMPEANYPASTTKWPECTSGQLLKGTVFTSITPTGVQCKDDFVAQNMFDGNPETHYQGPQGTDLDSFAGLILDQAYELTEVRVSPNPTLDSGSLFNFTLQGSNDGKHWVTVVSMFQDANSPDYHIYSPQSITDQRYIVAGYTARTDESIHWKGEGSYSMYRVCSSIVGELELYGNPAPATVLDDETFSSMKVNTINHFGGHIVERTNATIVSTDGSLTGTIIGSGGCWNKALYEKAFDGSSRTYFDPSIEGFDAWVGLKLDEPHRLTEARVMNKRGSQVDIELSVIQGSMDGRTWVTLHQFSKADIPSKQSYVSAEITDPNGYLYFRYMSGRTTMMGGIAEFVIFGEPAPAAEVEPAPILVATHDKFIGQFDITENRNVVTDNAIRGTIIGYSYGWDGVSRGYEKGFDNDFSTFYGEIPRCIGYEHWVGLMPDEPTVLGTVRIYKDHMLTTHYIQGSNDGENWVDLISFNSWIDEKDAEGWYTKTATDTTAYKYFRFINDAETEMSATEIRMYAAGTTPGAPAPETAAPETAAPETAAPETAAPETAAPATEAPADTDSSASSTPVIIGVAAAVVVVIIGIAAVVAKKKK